MWRALAILPLLAGAALAEPLTDEQIADKIVQESRAAYYATGEPCACPEDHARDGSKCGQQSAYGQPGGDEPKCYPTDVTPADITEYRAVHR